MKCDNSHCEEDAVVMHFDDGTLFCEECMMEDVEELYGSIYDDWNSL